MPGKLDEISEAIGGLRALTSGLERTFTQHCEDDDRRHAENIKALRENSQAITKLNETLAPLASTVAAMKPIVESYKVTRLKQAGAVSLALVLIGFLGWLVQIGISAIGAWLHLRG